MAELSFCKTALRRIAICALATCALALAIGVAPAFADTIPELTGDSQATPRSGVPVPVGVTLDQPSTRTTALEMLSQYRQEAYDEGIVDLPAGMTADQYVHGIVWDDDLERIAIQRAIEHSALSDLGHTRPDGNDCFYAVSNGVSSGGEGLAASWLPSSYANDISVIEYVRAYTGIAYGMSMWKSEKDAYISNRNLGTNYLSGHYEILIDPYYTRYGLANVGVFGSDWIACAVEADGAEPETNDESVGYSGTYTATIFANDNELITVSLNAFCLHGAVGVGEASQLAAVASSSVSGTDSWSVNPSGLVYESSDPAVLTVDENGKVVGVSEGIATVTMRMGAEVATVDVPVTDEDAAFRLYNPNSGEHFYTLDFQENYDLVVAGWFPEGLGWVSASDESVPVYRLYNSFAGEHHYTTDAAERDSLVASGWTDEGVGWHSDPAKGQVLYREYNPNMFSCNHNYTTDKAEHDYLVSLGWRDEGTAWYGVDVKAKLAE